MPVVISEFEVVAAPPPPASSARPAEANPPAASDAGTAWTIHDFEEILRRQAERAARVRAD